MGNSGSSSIFIQGNYLDCDNCSFLKTYLKEKKANVFDVGKNQFGFYTTKVPVSKLSEFKEDIQIILDSLTYNGFIRISLSETFGNYKEYRRKFDLEDFILD